MEEKQYIFKPVYDLVRLCAQLPRLLRQNGSKFISASF